MEFKNITKPKGSSTISCFKLFRSRKNNKVVPKSMIETMNNESTIVISQTKEDGGTRLKILVKKQDLEKILQVLKHASAEDSVDNKSCVEQRLNSLRKRQLTRSNAIRGRRKYCWAPVLQTIPEEL